MDTRHTATLLPAEGLPVEGLPVEGASVEAVGSDAGEAQPLGMPAPLFHSRRDFCLTACQALSLGAVAATLQACGGGSSNPNESGGNPLPSLPSLSATVVNGVATLTVAGTSLAAANGAAIVSTPNFGQVLVVRTDAATVSVLTSTCTHQQCTINGFENGIFQCPCHGSRFNATGGVVRGPATASLRRFNATITNDVITITA